jgi:hypothetical protein
MAGIYGVYLRLRIHPTKRKRLFPERKAVFFVIWLPFVDSFRAFISTPTGEVRETLEAIQCFALL